MRGYNMNYMEESPVVLAKAILDQYLVVLHFKIFAHLVVCSVLHCDFNLIHFHSLFILPFYV